MVFGGGEAVFAENVLGGELDGGEAVDVVLLNGRRHAFVLITVPPAAARLHGCAWRSIRGQQAQ
jgi:hypothetical protein